MMLALPFLALFMWPGIGLSPVFADDGHRHAHEPASESSATNQAGPSKPLKEGVRAVRGLKIYRDFCISCHGKNGDGKGEKAADLDRRVPDLTAAQALVRYPRERMLKALEDGHGFSGENTGAQRLTQADMADVVEFMQDAFMLPSGEADSSVGRKIYARTCSVCHGDRGNAASWAKNSLNPPPFDFTSYKAKKLSRRHMINTVTYGAEKTAMVGFATQLSADEVAAVVDYIRQTFIFSASLAGDTAAASATTETTTPPQGHDHSAHAGPDGKHDMARTFAGGLVGDPGNGEKLYKTNCAACHGVRGNGDGPRAYFIFPRPENFTGKRARAELNRPHLFTSISKGIVGTVMPAWSTALTDQEISDVAEYIFVKFVMVESDATSSRLLEGKGAADDASSGHHDHQHSHDPSKKN